MDTETHYSDVWVVIPAFNEAAVIGKVVTDVRSVFDHVVCVDDGSTDGTGDIARRSGAHLVRHPINLGQGAAIQTGIEYARKQPGAQVFATFDGDGQHRVKDVAAMVDRLGAGDVDVVIGTRFGRPVGKASASRPPLMKRIVLQTGARLSRRGRRLGLTDTNNGLRVFNKTVADGLNITMSGMSHATEFIMLIAENHWRVAEERSRCSTPSIRSRKANRCSTASTSFSTGFCEGGCHDELDPGAVDRVDHRVAVLPVAVAPKRAVACLGQGGLCLVRARRHLCRAETGRHHSGRKLVWVRRGTDLMLYALVMAFSFTTLSTYMRFKDLELRYARIARALALEGAQAPEQCR